MVLWQTLWAGIYLVEYRLGGKYIGRIFLDYNNPGGNFPGGSYPGWEFSGWELSEWELSWVGIFFGGDFPGGNCPGGIIRVRILRVGVFLVPEILAQKTPFLITAIADFNAKYTT